MVESTSQLCFILEAQTIADPEMCHVNGIRLGMRPALVLKVFRFLKPLDFWPVYGKSKAHKFKVFQQRHKTPFLNVAEALAYVA